AVDGTEEDRQTLLPFQMLASSRESRRKVRARPRQQEEHRELGAERGHARVLEVAVALVDHLGQVRDDAGAIPADGGQGEPLSHALPSSGWCGSSGTASTTPRKSRCQLYTVPAALR